MTPDNEFEHKVYVTNRFKRSFKSLSEDVQQRVMEKVQELSMKRITGKPLKGKFKDFKRIRVGKYRLIYSDKEPCRIYLYDIKLRETAYR
jgi:addiction module RelE/StbE family toxin